MPHRASDPIQIPKEFWDRDTVTTALRSRDIGTLFRLVRRHAGASQAQLGIAAGLDQGYISRIINGRKVTTIDLLERIADGLHLPDTARTTMGLAPSQQPPATTDTRRTNSAPEDRARQHTMGHRDITPRGSVATVSSVPDLHQVELLRQGLNDALGEGTMAEASLDDWERTVVSYGRATRDRPAGALVRGLSADLAELQRVLRWHRSASTLRRLTRVVAHLSGLMCLTLCKLDNRAAFHGWARTARLAAAEAGDPATFSWILAQEAYGHYYSTDLITAVNVAGRAQDVARGRPRVGSALAAALEARAHAAMGRHRETRECLARAEEILVRLDGDALIPSAFGYNEAQLRFHEGNAYTHLHDTTSALRAQDRALELCAPGDYTDWAMTRLDRASCLRDRGDISDALSYATETLTSLSEPQRQGLIVLRGNELLNGLPKEQQARPAAHDLRELLTLATGKNGVAGS
ncbi:MAG: helix-turn-helix transcriptional regulator [Actinobacteria bacterium]|nr:helix-turn-helix transcriptional regulator [Actinomycetota bacterium]MBI3687906.1 helix-turn-helix transcriptional regulator [Actinomycetota bacterium]